MILDVDIGNSRAKWRFGDATGAVVLNELHELAAPINRVGPVGRIRVSCVAGSAVEEQFSRLCMEHWAVKPEYARVVDQLGGISVAYQRPSALGVDRWLALLAAYQKTGGACAIIDAGSAVTVDFVDDAGRHLGGLILPGAGMMTDSLLRQTSAVKVGALTLPQKWQPGCDTVGCVENGVAAVFTGLLREITHFSVSHCGPEVALLVCGGDAEILACRDPGLRLQPHLVLDGLAIALP